MKTWIFKIKSWINKKENLNFQVLILNIQD